MDMSCRITKTEFVGSLGVRATGVWLCLAAGIGMWTAAAAALDVHSIRLGSYKTAEAAEEARAAAAETCSPAFVREEAAPPDKSYTLLVGHFPYYAEAWVCVKNLQGQGLFPGCEVVTWEWDGQELEQSRLPVSFRVNIDGLSGVSAWSPADLWASAGIPAPQVPDSATLAKPTADLSRAELLAVGFGATAREASVPALERFLSDHSSDAVANKVRLRLTRRLLGMKNFDRALSLLDIVDASGSANEKVVGRLLRGYVQSAKGDSASALESFCDVASDTKAASCVRLDALRRFAQIAHRERDYPTAWLAFEQIEQTAPDAATAADARMQRAGFAFELVLCEKGSWDDARRLCRSVDDIESAPVEPRATARLMFTETFFNEKNYDRAIEEADRLVADFPGVARERVTALYWKARSLQETHRVDEALGVYQAIEADPISPADLFPALNAKAKGLFHQARVQQRKGNAPAAQAAAAKLIERYPQSKEAKAYQAGQDISDK